MSKPIRSFNGKEKQIQVAVDRTKNAGFGLGYFSAVNFLQRNGLSYMICRRKDSPLLQYR